MRDADLQCVERHDDLACESLRVVGPVVRHRADGDMRDNRQSMMRSAFHDTPQGREIGRLPYVYKRIPEM
jgi:hypothetical protein